MWTLKGQEKTIFPHLWNNLVHSAMYMAKKNFHQLIWPQELEARSPGKSEDVCKGLTMTNLG